jgi:hypothetical protein
MRFLCEISIPTSEGNAAITSGELFAQFKKMVSRLKPEALYFGVMGGGRTMYMVIDLPSADKLPFTFEPFWLDWESEVFITPVMTLAELEKAGTDIEKILGERK